MELPDLGRHCSESDCHLLDFLPFVCECGKHFCSEHFNLHLQNCEVKIKPREIDTVKYSPRYVCSEDGCQASSLVPLICNVCKQHFCVEHRHIATHHQYDHRDLGSDNISQYGDKKPIDSTNEDINKHIDTQIAKAKSKNKNRALANKIQLMRLKNKAKGQTSIPTVDRLYFNVHCVFSAEKKVFPIFVSKTWTIGRAIDAIAVECNVQNNNNKVHAKKLRVFKDGGLIITKDMSTTLSSLVQNSVLENGEDLSMDYVDIT